MYTSHEWHNNTHEMIQFSSLFYQFRLFHLFCSWFWHFYVKEEYTIEVNSSNSQSIIWPLFHNHSLLYTETNSKIHSNESYCIICNSSPTMPLDCIKHNEVRKKALTQRKLLPSQYKLISWFLVISFVVNNAHYLRSMDLLHNHLLLHHYIHYYSRDLQYGFVEVSSCQNQRVNYQILCLQRMKYTYDCIQALHLDGDLKEQHHLPVLSKPCQSILKQKSILG